MNYYIDTHCHLNHPDYFGDLAEVLSRANDVDVRRVVCAGYDLESSAQGVKLAREIQAVRAAVGIHPHDAGTFAAVESQIRKLAEDKEHVVAIGETGLDYFRSLTPKDVQQEVFRNHIDLAHEYDLPLIVHSRDAQADVLAILNEKGLPKRGVVMHCLPADAEFARKAVEMGCFVGIAGTITFKNAEPLRQIAANLPLDRVFLETDAPYLTPHPHRGQRNEPSYIPLTAAAVADVMGVTTQEVKMQTTANALGFFGQYLSLP